jgi:hypothetical protein
VTNPTRHSTPILAGIQRCTTLSLAVVCLLRPNSSSARKLYCEVYPSLSTNFTYPPRKTHFGPCVVLMDES